MARVSVVVPMHDVESYLATCLQSIARQKVDDLEVVMVDDGSTDRSGEIAERFSRHDRRFRLVRQSNGGLGNARNTGSDAATGEFLAFVDGDDVVAPGAYDRLLRTLDATGSDFASGNVLRLNRQGTVQAQFLARTFASTRLKTHVTRFRPLLADRTAWNKLWRRSFWDEQRLRFPEGVLHEDIPVTLPAHVAAASVDVIATPVYQWRVREDGAPSITQRRLEHAVLRDRLAAIGQVQDRLAASGSPKLRRWYDASIVADDLRLHLNLLDEADEEYRTLFLDGANAVLEGASPRIFRPLPAIDRLKWHLVRQRRLPELIDVVRFQNERAAGRPPVRVRGRYYGDYPHRGDRALGVPRSAYRLGRRDEDLALTAHLDDVRRDGDTLRVRGHAYINGLGAPTPAHQRTVITALRPGRWRALRVRVAALRLPTAPARRRDLAAGGGLDVSWSGFEAKLDATDLRTRGRWVDGTWDLYASTRTGLVRRRRARFVLDSAGLVGAVDLGASGEAAVRAAVTPDGAVRVEVRTHWVRLGGHRRIPASEVLELAGEACLPSGAEHTILLERRTDALGCRFPLTLGDGDGPRAFTARVPLQELLAAPPSVESLAAEQPGIPESWELWVTGGGRRFAVALPEGSDGATWRAGGHELTWVRTRRGDAALVTREPVRTAVPAHEPAEPLLSG